MNNYIERLNKLVQIKANGKYTVFAKKAGITPSTFQNYMNGRLPHPEHLIRLCETYNVNVNWLLTGMGKMLTDAEKKEDVEGNIIGNGNIAIANGVNNVVNIGNGPDTLQLGEGVQMLQKILSSGNKELIRMTLTNLKITAEACMKKQNE